MSHDTREEAPDCSGWAGYFLGHQMKPRYETSEVRPPWTQVAGGHYQGPGTSWEKNSYYVGEVCTRCGYAIWPPGQEEEEEELPAESDPPADPSPAETEERDPPKTDAPPGKLLGGLPEGRLLNDGWYPYRTASGATLRWDTYVYNEHHRPLTAEFDMVRVYYHWNGTLNFVPWKDGAPTQAKLCPVLQILVDEAIQPLPDLGPDAPIIPVSAFT